LFDPKEDLKINLADPPKASTIKASAASIKIEVFIKDNLLGHVRHKFMLFQQGAKKPHIMVFSSLPKQF